MKINPSNPYVQKFHNYDNEPWLDEVIKNNPNCIHHLVEVTNNNPSDEQEILRQMGPVGS